MNILKDIWFLIKLMIVVVGTISVPTTFVIGDLHSLKLSCKDVKMIEGQQLTLEGCSNKNNESSEIHWKSLTSQLSKNSNWSLLSILDTDLAEIPESICRLERLQALQLNKNGLKYLASQCFNRLKNIEIIRITNNLIECLENGLFDGLLKLKVLNLDYNLISHIETYVFSNIESLPNLLEISMAHNRLVSIDPWPIIRGISLNHTVINLGTNQISKFTNDLNWYFNCSMRQEKGFNFKYILRDNKIMHLNDFFSSIFKTEVDILCLRGNKFKTDVFIVMDDFNPYVCDCVDYNYLTKIDMLGRPNFMSQARCSRPIYNIRWMSLKSSDMVCNETNVSCLKDCSCYKEGKVSYQIICPNLRDLPDKLPVRNLTTKYNNPYKLLFSGSKISTLHNRDYFKNVKWLDLSKNQIAKITESAMKSLLTISKVYLHSNNLTTLPHIDVEVKSKSLSLHGNQWDCSCENIWFKRWLEKLRDENILIEPGSIYCQYPEWLTNKNIFKINDQDFCINPNANSNTRTLLTGLLFAISIIFSLLVLIYLLLKRFKVQLNTHLNVHPFDKDECRGENMDYDAFISCSYLDRHLAIELVQLLESKGYRIYYNEKSFTENVPSLWNVPNDLFKSKRVVCLLSENFLQCPYCLQVLKLAFQMNIQSRKNRLIALSVNSHALDNRLISSEMDSYLKTPIHIDFDKSNKYINRLLYYMPVETIRRVIIF